MFQTYASENEGNINKSNGECSNGCSSEKAYTIGGVPILFPYKAYPSQICMMDKIIKCLNKKFNCLLESPTGSGKSLALLCACLAWQKKTKKEIKKMEAELERELNTRGVILDEDVHLNEGNKIQDNFDQAEKEIAEKLEKHNINDDSKPADTSSNEEAEKLDRLIKNSRYAAEKNKKRGIIYIDNVEDMDDFQPVKKCKSISRLSNSPSGNSTSNSPHLQKNSTPSSPRLHSPILNSDIFTSKNDELLQNTEINSTSSPVRTSKVKYEGQTANDGVLRKLPRIYFGTRTHKQIEQIIRELRKTPYKDVKMTILSSRERTCIHPEVSRTDNKNEACEELIHDKNGPGCRYFRNSKMISHYNSKKLLSAFDLEDFVGVCRRAKACPYYGARELLISADIVFCPYNYLVDPLIRSALDISLKGTIVVMDEAHNLEDSAREAASSSITLSQLTDSITDLQKMGQRSQTIPECYLYVAKILTNLADWLKLNSNNLSEYTSFDSSAKVWNGNDMIAVLNYVGLGPESFDEFKIKFSKIFAEKNESKDENSILNNDDPKISGLTITCLKCLIQPLTYLYYNNMIFVPDYRFVVIKSKLSKLQSKKRTSALGGVELTMHFWCLNPAVAFSDIKDDIHTLIVASGTLSPLISFQSELGMPFQITLEANHVISNTQVWVGTIGRGPNNNLLNATFQNSSTFAFQDDVGNLVLQVCMVVPHGILCFLPSYSMLEKLINRWELTGLFEKLSLRKKVFCEPRGQSNDFVQVIGDFYNAVKGTENNSEGEVDGALFFAVCRGKVSEGLDFADNNARAVITIGIPFPNIKDIQVDLKRKYNDMHSSKRNILTGSAWYEIQAFRALNQALGRCIRHRDDFGALIIVDERFQNERHLNSLSKWIRKEVKHYPSFNEALSSLSCFVQRAKPIQ
ncbi:Fanconi anemia group J protein-like [Stegodyphus dumicola]|uniref:Fanconi anemia group J protein-like n=1 Tax=Stegodyphus dumicola TaxID=202533 RepID=UPI0015A903EC|nr:Fanconi anemia group J protein-like [Stegodyphus dumicola]